LIGLPAPRAAGPPDQVGTHADRLPFDRAREILRSWSGCFAWPIPSKRQMFRVFRV